MADTSVASLRMGVLHVERVQRDGIFDGQRKSQSGRIKVKKPFQLHSSRAPSPPRACPLALLLLTHPCLAASRWRWPPLCPLRFVLLKGGVLYVLLALVAHTAHSHSRIFFASEHDS